MSPAAPVAGARTRHIAYRRRSLEIAGCRAGRRRCRAVSSRGLALAPALIGRLTLAATARKRGSGRAPWRPVVTSARVRMEWCRGQHCCMSVGVRGVGEVLAASSSPIAPHPDHTTVCCFVGDARAEARPAGFTGRRVRCRVRRGPGRRGRGPRVRADGEAVCWSGEDAQLDVVVEERELAQRRRVDEGDVGQVDDARTVGDGPDGGAGVGGVGEVDLSRQVGHGRCSGAPFGVSRCSSWRGVSSAFRRGGPELGELALQLGDLGF
jgi:hypothetical protein